MADRFITVKWAKPVVCLSATGEEQLSQLYTLDVKLLSEEPITIGDAIGQPLTLELAAAGESTRYLSGMTARVAYRGSVGNYHLYEARVRPDVWKLTCKSDCRIFQEKSALDIVKAVLREHGVTIQESLSSSYEVRTYCVQYNETDFDFVSRLMEEEGIYYYFEHQSGTQTMVLGDSYSAHKKFSNYEALPYYPPDTNAQRDSEHLYAWQASEQFDSASWVLQDYDFERPSADLTSKKLTSLSTSTVGELYSYPGGYVVTGVGTKLAQVRLEARQALANQRVAAGNAVGICPGYLFSAEHPPVAGDAAEYLIVSARYEMHNPGLESGVTSGADQWSCSLTAIPSRNAFRAPQKTPKPRVFGPQTATVVGKKGEEIWTDQYGRVKVQFPWDREGRFDEKSSCWVRVAQLWADGAWGAQHIPRIGQEVVVEFLEGDPDRPLVTGCVYNGTNKPPFSLPANQTISGLRSSSSKQGNASTFNELSFEDKKGSELFFMQAEKDREILVKNDEKLTVENDRVKEIKNDETTTVTGNRTEEVKKDEKITVTGSRTEEVKKDEKITVKGAQTIDVTKDQTITVKGGRKVTVSKTDALKANQKVTIEGVQEISLKSGASSITLKAGGQIEIKGVQVTVKGSAMTNVEAGGMTKVKGAAVVIEGSMITAK